MGWLQDTWGKTKKAFKEPGEIIGTALGVPGLYTAGKEIKNAVTPSKSNIGTNIQKTAQKEQGEIGSIRSQMETDYNQFRGGVANTRGQYRTDEDAADTGYDTKVDANSKAMGTLEEGLAAKADALESEAAAQATDASKVYTDSVRPQMQKNMENAMTLKDYMDPNNAVQTGYRDMFAAQGENVRKQGMADYGILAAMGGQAARGAMQGRALTGSQMMGQTQAGLGQAGAAYQNAQQRAEGLREEGIRTGIEQSSKAYAAGQDARRDFTDEEERQLNLGTKSRGERQGYAREAGNYRMSGVEREADINKGRYDRDTSKRGARYGEDLGDQTRDQSFKYGMGELRAGDVGRKYGTTRQGMLAQDAADQAREASIRSMMTGGMGSAAQAYGAYQGAQGGGQNTTSAQAPAPKPGQDTSYLDNSRQRRSYYA
jgi:hypothetical protein